MLIPPYAHEDTRRKQDIPVHVCGCKQPGCTGKIRSGAQWVCSLKYKPYVYKPGHREPSGKVDPQAPASRAFPRMIMGTATLVPSQYFR